MREQLKQFEGQLVVARGRITERRTRQDNGLIEVCLAAVEVRPLRTDIPLLDVPCVRIDHCWLQMDPERLDWRGLLRRMECCAKVNYYTRSDGSVDLGLTATPGVSIDALWNQCNAEPRRNERLHALQTAVYAIEQGLPYWHWTGVADKAAAALKKAIARFEAEEASNLGALLVAPANGKCERMRAADPFTALRRRTVARGFA